MCGFGGELRRDGPADARALERMGQALARRGPDGYGLWTSGRMGLVHRRLSIIDLSDRGAQPMIDPKLGLEVAFNGCIYNHLELRERLQSEGYEFFSTSDTEVILKAWHRWGSQCVERFKGMFAFAIHERDSGRLSLARDRLGIKPLYLTQSNGTFRFASTLPALLAAGGVDTDLDPDALHHYFSWHGVVPAPLTLLKGVRKLPAATVLTIEPDGRHRERRYWQVEFDRSRVHQDMTDTDWEEALLEALRTAVRRRMVSDVPVGVLLSGGLDSSLIVALLAHHGHADVQTFTVGFSSTTEREGDEFDFSALVAERFGTRHDAFHVTDHEVVDAVQKAIAAMSEPMPSHDAVAFYLLSEHVSERCKVVQSGQGADEVFAGYSWYPPLAALDGAPPREALAAYRDVFFDRPHEELAEILTPALTSATDVSEAFAAEHFGRPGIGNAVDRALRLDTEVMLVDDPVKRLDNMSMAHGLEIRTPFLDHDLVELAAACPTHLKLGDGGKGVLKRAARGVVPDEIIDRPKGYFPVPALSHLDGPAIELVRDTLTSARARDRGVFRQEHVDELLADPNRHRTTLDGSKLWQLAVVELWLEAQGL
jgi:asparagine synthase (glutamine-hydrolysing)